MDSPFLLPTLQFSVIHSPFTSGKRGNSGRTTRKIRQTFLLPTLQFSVIHSPFTSGKRGDSGRTTRKINENLYVCRAEIIRLERPCDVRCPKRQLLFLARVQTGVDLFLNGSISPGTSMESDPKDHPERPKQKSL